MRDRYRLVILVILVIVVSAFLFSRPPMAQSLNYHNFVDQRAALGIPNFLNVISNLPFLIVGIWGLAVTTSRGHQESFLSDKERSPYIVFFLGVALTCVGSSYYHLHPSNDTLVWDRLPMTLGFMGILSATIAERISVNTGLKLLPFLVAAGVLSVFYWAWSEAYGQGDLRPYYLIQFGSLFLMLALLLLFRPRYTRSWCLWVALGLYVTAKFLESFDRQIYLASHFVSGHTLKHLAAATAAFFVAIMLERRSTRRVGSHETASVLAPE